MDSVSVIQGTIISGVKKAAFFTDLSWVQEQCMEKLGFHPYPGTLNLRIAPHDLPKIESLKQKADVKLIPPDPQFCEATVWPLSIKGTVCALILPADDVRVHGKDVIEILAPTHLKRTLNVDDGDVLRLEIGRPHNKGQGNALQN